MGIFRRGNHCGAEAETLRKIKAQQADHERRIAALEERKRLLKLVLREQERRTS